MVPPTHNRRESPALRLLFILIAVLAVWLGFATFPPRAALTVVQHAGYFVMLSACGLFGFYLWKSLPRIELKERWREGGWKTVLLIVAGSVLIHVQEPHGFKIVNDELMQVSTSQRFHHSRDAEIVSRGYRLGTDFVPMQGMLDKRPLLFPFLVSLLHDVTGYRPENVFILNAALTPLLLGLLYLLGAALAGAGGGGAAVLLFSTVPLLTQAAAGGGFEVLNLVMILATILLGMRYARGPNHETLSAFCLSGVLLANVRYESVLFIPAVGVVVAWVWWRQRRIELPFGLLVAPLLLVIYPLQMNVVKLNPGLLQLADRPSEHGLYSVAYFYDNIGKALHYFTEWDRSQANSHLVLLAGMVGLGFFLMQLYRSQRAKVPMTPERVAVTVFVLALAGQGLLMLCYFWGAYDDVVTVRLSLPTQLLFVVTFVLVYPELARRLRRRWLVLNAAVGVYFIVWTLPTIAQRGYAHTNLAAETSNWYREYLRERPDRNLFVIEANMPVLWLAYGVPSVGYDVLSQRMSQFCSHFAKRSLGECLVVQKLVVTDFATGELAPITSHDFGSAAKLETVRQVQYTPTYVIRISRIVSIDETAMLAWAEKMKSQGSSKGPVVDTERQEREARYTREWLQSLP